MRDTGKLAPGEVVGDRYVIEKLLKAGGMGAVYVVRHAGTHERLALKVMKPELISHEGARAKFEQEARVGAKISSPGIVKVSDAGVDVPTGMPFLVMELLRGRDLGEVVAIRGRIAKEDVARYLAQAARTLDKAHAAGVVHRDLKPDNLFLADATDEEPERIKILDFGIAKMLLSATQQQTTHAQGTPLYMAPEQLATGRIGLSADIWPLGLIAYTLLVGHHYWNATSILELHVEMLSGTYESPSTRAARVGVQLPLGFDEWFFRCVCMNPAGRTTSAGEAARALAAVLGLGGASSEVVSRGGNAHSLVSVPTPVSANTQAAAVTPLGALPAEPSFALDRTELASPSAAAVAPQKPNRRRLKLAIAGAVLFAVAGGLVLAVSLGTRSTNDPKVDEPTSKPGTKSRAPRESKTVSSTTPSSASSPVSGPSASSSGAAPSAAERLARLKKLEKDSDREFLGQVALAALAEVGEGRLNPRLLKVLSLLAGPSLSKEQKLMVKLELISSAPYATTVDSLCGSGTAASIGALLEDSKAAAKDADFFKLMSHCPLETRLGIRVSDQASVRAGSAITSLVILELLRPTSREEDAEQALARYSVWADSGTK